MSTATNDLDESRNAPAFCEGIQYFGEAWPQFDTLGARPVIAEGQQAIANAA